jgi:YD repeat-containing protein
VQHKSKQVHRKSHNYSRSFMPSTRGAGFMRALAMFATSLLVGLLGPASALSSPPSNAFRFVHDVDGRLRAAINPEGDTAVYGWDAAGNLLSISRHASSALSVVQFNPARGEVGATVTIEGTGFSTTPASNTVKFNGTAASVGAASATSLTVKVPAGATTGSVTVSTAGEGPVSSAETFTVAESSAPHISSISPTMAATGEEVTVSGSHFESTISANSVTLNRARPEVVTASSGSIKFKVPPSTLGGRVAVATAEGSSTGPDLFVPPSGTTASKVGFTGRFALGESKTAEFVGSEKVALLLFDGTAGQRVSMVLSSSTIASGTASIWSPSGSSLASASFSKSSGGYIETATLPATGTYTVLLSPSGTGTGTVKLTAYTVEDITGSITPTATAEGVKQHVSITTPGQVARYSVTMTAGEKVSFKTTNTAFTGAGTRIAWFNPSGKEVAGSTWAASEPPYYFGPTTFSSAGTYTLVVDPSSSYTGSIDLQLWEDPDVTGQTITPSEAGGSVTSTINVPGQRELITFSGTKEQRISLVPSELKYGGGTVSILKPSGAELAEGSGSISSILGPVTLPESGTYTLIVDPSSTGTGTVKLTAYTVEDITGSITPTATAEGVKQHVPRPSPRPAPTRWWSTPQAATRARSTCSFGKTRTSLNRLRRRRKGNPKPSRSTFRANASLPPSPGHRDRRSLRKRSNRQSQVA